MRKPVITRTLDYTVCTVKAFNKINGESEALTLILARHCPEHLLPRRCRRLLAKKPWLLFEGVEQYEKRTESFTVTEQDFLEWILSERSGHDN